MKLSNYLNIQPANVPLVYLRLYVIQTMTLYKNKYGLSKETSTSENLKQFDSLFIKTDYAKITINVHKDSFANKGTKLCDETTSLIPSYLTKAVLTKSMSNLLHPGRLKNIGTIPKAIEGGHDH